MTTDSMAIPMGQPDPLPYPTTLEVARPATQSRITNLPLGIGLLIRTLLLIPHYILLYFIGVFAMIIYFIAQFAILFTGNYPEGMFKLVKGYVRWTVNVSGYQYSLYDDYPPFTMDVEAYPLTYDTPYPQTSSRVLNLPFLVIRTLLLLPHLIIVAFLGIVALLAIFLAKFAILFQGTFPEGLYKFTVGYLRWYTRVTAYTFGLTHRYPPFSLD